VSRDCAALITLATDVKANWDQAHAGHASAIYHYVRIGEALRSARQQFKVDHDYGRWFQAQHFVFGLEWRRQLRIAAEHEPGVRAWWLTELQAGREPSLTRCFAALRSRRTGQTTTPVPTAVATDPYPESERRACFKEVVASLPRHDNTSKANHLEQSLRAWEAEHESELLDTLAPCLRDDLDADARADVIAEILGVLRGE